MSIASDRLALYIAAEASILRGQEVRFDGRSLRRADLTEVRAAISSLQAQVAAEQQAAAGQVGPFVMYGDVSGRCGRFRDF